jgi:DNA-binding NarL/FixJ family response regulator
VKIFIADDSPIVRDRLIAMLSEMEGVEVVGHAEDAAAATQMIRDLRPDAVVLDIRLANSSGIDVLKAIKMDRPEVLVIMLTLYPYAQYRESCMKAGASFFLDKATGFEQIPELLGLLARKLGPEAA